jgi:hypothetical protein
MHFSRSRKGLRRVFRAQKRFSQKKPVFPSENRVFSQKKRDPAKKRDFSHPALEITSHLAPFLVPF